MSAVVNRKMILHYILEAKEGGGKMKEGCDETYYLRHDPSARNGAQKIPRQALMRLMLAEVWVGVGGGGGGDFS